MGKERARPNSGGDRWNPVAPLRDRHEKEDSKKELKLCSNGAQTGTKIDPTAYNKYLGMRSGRRV